MADTAVRMTQAQLDQLFLRIAHILRPRGDLSYQLAKEQVRETTVGPDLDTLAARQDARRRVIGFSNRSGETLFLRCTKSIPSGSGFFLAVGSPILYLDIIHHRSLVQAEWRVQRSGAVPLASDAFYIVEVLEV